jgi:hypothetical protein
VGGGWGVGVGAVEREDEALAGSDGEGEEGRGQEAGGEGAWVFFWVLCVFVWWEGVWVGGWVGKGGKGWNVRRVFLLVVGGRRGGDGREDCAMKPGWWFAFMRAAAVQKPNDGVHPSPPFLIA